MKQEEVLQLQRLRVPAGWEMVINGFLDVDVTQYEENDTIWICFGQDIMYMKQITDGKKKSFGLDLEWRPDLDPKGQFRLNVIIDDDFLNPIETFRSRDKNKIVDKIEEYLEKLSD